MKIVYKSVERTIREALKAADEQNRKIQYIALEWWEIEEVHAMFRKLAICYPPLKDAYSYTSDEIVGQLYGIELRKS